MQPFFQFKENPSWLAVKPLHNTVIVLDESFDPISVESQVVVEEDGNDIPKTHIHISALEVPVVYEAVLDTVPGLHLRPPILPESLKDGFFPTPPKKGYDLIFHIGVAGRGPLRVEKVGHKLGYQMKDASGKLAPLVETPMQDYGRNRDGFLGAVNMEMLAMDMVETHPAPEGAPRLNRGFGIGYDKFPEELYSDIDLTALVHDLKRQGVEVRNCSYRTLVETNDNTYYSKSTLRWMQGTIYATLSTTARLLNPDEAHMRRDGHTRTRKGDGPKFYSCIVHQ